MNLYSIPSVQTLCPEQLSFIPKTQTAFALGACGGGGGCAPGTVSDVPFLFCTFNLDSADELNGLAFFIDCASELNFTLSNCQFTNIEDCGPVGGGTLVQCTLENVNCDAVATSCSGGPPSSVGIVVNGEPIPCNVVG